MYTSPQSQDCTGVYNFHPSGSSGWGIASGTVDPLVAHDELPGEAFYCQHSTLLPPGSAPVVVSSHPAVQATICSHHPILAGILPVCTLDDTTIEPLIECVHCSRSVFCAVIFASRGAHDAQSDAVRADRVRQTQFEATPAIGRTVYFDRFNSV